MKKIIISVICILFSILLIFYGGPFGFIAGGYVLYLVYKSFKKNKESK